jgi:hypothetical protein
MATGDVVAILGPPQPRDDATSATPDQIVNANNDETINVLDFDPSQTETIYFVGKIIGYSGSLGLDVEFNFGASTDTNTAHKFRWQAAFWCLDVDSDQVKTANHTYSYQGTSRSVLDDVDKIDECTINFTHSEIDSIADGKTFILQLQRDHDHADDDASGDAEFWPQTIAVLQGNNT